MKYDKVFNPRHIRKFRPARVTQTPDAVTNTIKKLSRRWLDRLNGFWERNCFHNRYIPMIFMMKSVFPISGLYAN